MQVEQRVEQKMASEEERGLVRRASLDQVALTTQRSLTQDEFLDVIAYADALQRFDERRGDERLLASATESLTLDEGLSLPVVYQIARELSIDEDYVERALAIRHPSVEQQLADIRDHGVIPSLGVICSTYRRTIRGALRSNVPLDKFSTRLLGGGCGREDLYFYRVDEKEEKSKFLFWEKIKTVRAEDFLAKFYFFPDDNGVPRGKFKLKISLGDPLFLRACGKTLERLNEEFKDQMHLYDIRHHYTVK